MRRLTVRANEQDGAISIMAAGLMLAMLLSTALAVDVGRVASVSRDQQGITDRAALDSVLQVSRSDAMTLEGLYPDVADAVIESMDRNPGSTSTAEQLEVVAIYLGTTANGQFEAFCGEGKPDPDPDPDGPPPPPLCTGAVDPDGSLRDSVNAVWVATESVVPFVFAIGGPTDDESGLVGKRVRKVSIAETLEVAGIMVGSRLASLDDGGLFGELLNAFVCGEAESTSCDVDVDLVSYKGLGDLSVNFGVFVERLENMETQSDFTVGSVDEMMSATLTAAELLRAAATVLQGSDSWAEGELLQSIATEMDGSVGVDWEMSLEDLIEFSATNRRSAMESQINVLGLVTGVIQVANGKNTLDIDDLTVAIPGVLSASTSLELISAPAQAFGPARWDGSRWVTQAETAQAQLDLGAELDLDEIADLGSIVDSLLSGFTLGDVEYVVEPRISATVAQGTSGLRSIECSQDEPPVVQQDVMTGVVDLEVALAATEIQIGLRYLGTPVATVRITLSADAETLTLEASDPVLAEFDEGAYPRGPVTVGGVPLALEGAAVPLAVDVAVDVQILGGLGLIGSTVNALLSGVDTLLRDAIGAAVNETMPDVLARLVSELVNPTLDMVGVQLGGADVWANSADCAYRRLAPVSLD